MKYIWYSEIMLKIPPSPNTHKLRLKTGNECRLYTYDTNRYAARSTNPVLCDKLERWDGVGGGREIQEGRGICMPSADSC